MTILVAMIRARRVRNSNGRRDGLVPGGRGRFGTIRQFDGAAAPNPAGAILAALRGALEKRVRFICANKGGGQRVVCEERP